MNQVKKLLRENNARESALTPEARKKMTDVVVYLRGQDLSMLAQEEIRRDIQEMVLAAQERGETMDQVVGGDYQAFCDEIVAAVPRRSRKSRFLSTVGDLLPALSVLLGIWTVNRVVHALLAGSSPLYLAMTKGEAVSLAAILILGAGMVEWICRSALKDGEKKQNMLLLWLLVVGVLAAILLPTLFWKQTLCTVFLPVAVVVTCLPALLSWGLSRRKEG